MHSVFAAAVLFLLGFSSAQADELVGLWRDPQTNLRSVVSVDSVTGTQVNHGAFNFVGWSIAGPFGVLRGDFIVHTYNDLYQSVFVLFKYSDKSQQTITTTNLTSAGIFPTLAIFDTSRPGKFVLFGSKAGIAYAFFASLNQSQFEIDQEIPLTGWVGFGSVPAIYQGSVWVVGAPLGGANRMLRINLASGSVDTLWQVGSVIVGMDECNGALLALTPQGEVRSISDTGSTLVLQLPSGVYSNDGNLKCVGNKGFVRNASNYYYTLDLANYSYTTSSSALPIDAFDVRVPIVPGP